MTKPKTTREGLIFPASIAAANDLDDLYDFVWPTAISLWNLKWQLSGYVQAHPDASENELSARFVSGSRINPPHKLRWQNLKGFATSDWDEQKSHLARFLLLSSFSVFEAYLSEMAIVLGLDESDQLKFSKVPSVYDKHNNRIPPSKALLPSGLPSSTLMERLVYPTMKQVPENGINRLETLLQAFWAAKYVRNSTVHGAGPIATSQSQWLRDFLSDYVRSNASANPNGETLARYGVKGLRPFDEITRDGLPKVTLPATVAFIAILRQLVYAYDVELSRTEVAKHTLINRIVQETKPRWFRDPFSGDKAKRLIGFLRAQHGIIVDTDPTKLADLEELDRLAVAEDRRIRPPRDARVQALRESADVLSSPPTEGEVL